MVNPACPLAREPPPHGVRTPAPPTPAPTCLWDCRSGRQECLMPVCQLGPPQGALHRFSFAIPAPAHLLPGPQTCLLPPTPKEQQCSGQGGRCAGLQAFHSRGTGHSHGPLTPQQLGRRSACTKGHPLPMAALLISFPVGATPQRSSSLSQALSPQPDPRHTWSITWR